VPILARAAAVAFMFVLLSAPAALQGWFGGGTGPYVVTTIALAVTAGMLAAWWHGPVTAGDLAPGRPENGRYAWITVTAASAAVLLFATAHSWIGEILTFPIDPYRGDMIVVVREALRRVLAGLNPYTTYHLPWPAALSYGPMLWGPYAVPMLLQLDIRFLTVAGELFVPVACAIAAVVSAVRGRAASAAGALAILAAISLNGPLAQFTSLAHTPVYWPLLALFTWLAARERWRAAAFALGLLVVARMTMIAVVPVFLMAVWVRDRPRFATVCALMVLAIGLPFLPFAIWDPRALFYPMYGNYETVVKVAVWPDETTVPHTIGLTGVLLTHHLHRFVEVFQIVAMTGVYAACWILLRRGRSPIASMGAALLAFSMTTLWPVTYIYFDVFVLLAAGILADMPWLDSRSSTAAVMRGWAAALAAAVVLVSVFGASMLRLRADERGVITLRGAPNQAAVLLLRRTISPAVVDVRIRGGSAGGQRIDVTLNGAPLGTVDVSTGEDHVMLSVPESPWQIGANLLELSPAAAISFRDVAVRPTRSVDRTRP
jgi:hypothetical protein